MSSVDNRSINTAFAIDVRNLTRSFGNHLVLDNIDLKIPSGCLLGLLGPNGVGKSTLVNVISGVLPPNRGSVEIHGVSVTTDPVAVKMMMGTVPDGLALFDYLTVWEHLELIGSVYGLDTRTVNSRGQELLELFGLASAAGQLAKTGSYGMRKKTALAMALLPNPRVLVLDEPFEGLDPLMMSVVQGALRQAADRGVAALITSHTLAVMQHLLDQYAILHEGKLKVVGAISELEKGGRTLESEYLGYFRTSSKPSLKWLG